MMSEIALQNLESFCDELFFSRSCKDKLLPSCEASLFFSRRCKDKNYYHLVTTNYVFPDWRSFNRDQLVEIGATETRQSDVPMLLSGMVGHCGDSECCTICGLVVSGKDALMLHMRIHTAQPYKCPVCASTFTNSSNLTRHIRTHTGKKPYSCLICGKDFSRSDNRRMHMAVVHSKSKSSQSS